MSDVLDRDAAPASADELEAAALLAAAVEGQLRPGVDGEALAAVFLLQAAARHEIGNEPAEVRLRRRLRWLRLRRVGVQVAAAVAAAVLVGGVVHLVPRPRTTAMELELREQEARRAVAVLLAGREAGDRLRPLRVAERQHELLATIERNRFEALRWSALDQAVAPTRSPTETESPQPTPTEPGG